MPFKDTMSTILPPRYLKGRKYKPEITTGSDGILQDFHAPRKRHDQKWHSHGGVDMNYHHDSGAPLGQNGINREHPPVHSPVTGTVTDVKKEWGMVEVTDENGFKHQLRHLDEMAVKKGDTVVAGQNVGTMGGRGPSGSNEYPQHVHYSVTAPDGTKVNPETHWNNTTVGKNSSSFFPLQGKTEFKHVSVLDHATQLRLKNLRQGITIANGETLRREGDKVWRIEPNGSTRGYFISP